MSFFFASSLPQAGHFQSSFEPICAVSMIPSRFVFAIAISNLKRQAKESNNRTLRFHPGTVFKTDYPHGCRLPHEHDRGEIRTLITKILSLAPLPVRVRDQKWLCRNSNPDHPVSETGASSSWATEPHNASEWDRTTNIAGLSGTPRSNWATLAHGGPGIRTQTFTPLKRVPLPTGVDHHFSKIWATSS